METKIRSGRQNAGRIKTRQANDGKVRKIRKSMEGIGEEENSRRRTKYGEKT